MVTGKVDWKVVDSAVHSVALRAVNSVEKVVTTVVVKVADLAVTRDT